MFGNLLNTAMGAIPTQTVQWSRFINRTQNDRGIWINEYAEPVSVRGSFQAVEDRTAKELGFDISKDYAVLYVSHPIQDVNRGEAPDRIEYGGDMFDVMGETDWYLQDGWKSVYCVRIDS